MPQEAEMLAKKAGESGMCEADYSEWFAYSIEKKVTALFTWLVQCLIGGVMVDVDKLAILLDKTESLSNAMKQYKKLSK